MLGRIDFLVPSQQIKRYQAFFQVIGCCQWNGQGGGMGAIAPHFCQDGARYFLKIDEKIGVGRG